MKKNCILSFILVAALLTGCSNTTAESTSINAKQQSGKAMSAAVNNTSSVNSQQKKDKFEISDVTVNVNATITPIEQDLSVIRVTPHEFTSADLKRWKDTLFADTTLYEYWGADAIEAKYQYHNVEYLRGETDSDMIPSGNTHHLKFRAGLYDNSHEGLSSVEQTEPDSNKHYIRAYFMGEDGETTVPYRKCSEEEAKKLADQVIQDLGLDRDGWQITDTFQSESTDCCRHVINCTRYYEDVPNRSDFFSESLILTSDSPLESFSVIVENGAIAEITLNSPMDIVEREQKSAATLPFDEVYSHFQRNFSALDLKQEYLAHAFTDGVNDAEYAAAHMTINITKIEEGLCCVKAEDSDTVYRLVPAWVFKGSYLVNGELWGEDINFIVINALDGSVIR